jgi:hypothetical protein
MSKSYVLFYVIIVFQMKNAHKLRFEYVPQLHLLDLKAQKKNVPCKLFLNLPLTLEEEIATKTLAPVAAA